MRVAARPLSAGCKDRKKQPLEKKLFRPLTGTPIVQGLPHASRVLIASSRGEAAKAAIWATVIEPFPGHEGAWLACDSAEALEFALANRHKFIFSRPRAAPVCPSPNPRRGREPRRVHQVANGWRPLWCLRPKAAQAASKTLLDQARPFPRILLQSSRFLPRLIAET